MFEWVHDRAGAPDPWDDDVELVPLALVDWIVGPSGLQPVAEIRYRVDCPVAPELFR